MAPGKRPGQPSKGNLFIMHTLVAYYLGRPASLWRAMLPQAGRKG
jgi:hypothetical protein